MAKDPAFLFYSQRWLEGTAEFSSAEKGVYIDLLAHQHQKGSLPSETSRLCRLTGLSETEFLPIWNDIKHKFGKTSLNRLVNQTLNEITTERTTKGLTNTLTGKFASLIKSITHLPPEFVETVKKEFKVTDFIPFGKRHATERLTEWFYGRLLIGKESIINIDKDIKDSKRGVGKEKGFSDMPSFENYNGLPEIKIGAAIQLFKITKQTDVTKEDIEGLWEIFKIQNLTGKKFYKDSDAVYSHYLNWIKTQNIIKNGANKQIPGTTRFNEGANQLLDKLKREVTTGTK